MTTNSERSEPLTSISGSTQTLPTLKMLKKIRMVARLRRVFWRNHALARMLERDICRKDVFRVIENGQIIEDYGDLKPYPGCLIFGKSGQKALHVVLAFDADKDMVYVITAYAPDNEHFMENGKTRKGDVKDDDSV